MKVNRIFLIFIFITSCYHADGIVRENDVEFKIVSKHEIITLDVFDVYSEKRLLPNDEGVYAFTTPFVRIFSNIFLFIEYESRSTEDIKLLEIRQSDNLLAVISLYDFNQLPTDKKGIYLLEIEK